MHRTDCVLATADTPACHAMPCLPLLLPPPPKKKKGALVALKARCRTCQHTFKTLLHHARNPKSCCKRSYISALLLINHPALQLRRHAGGHGAICEGHAHSRQHAAVPLPRCRCTQRHAPPRRGNRPIALRLSIHARPACVYNMKRVPARPSCPPSAPYAAARSLGYDPPQLGNRLGREWLCTRPHDM